MFYITNSVIILEISLVLSLLMERYFILTAIKSLSPLIVKKVTEPVEISISWRGCDKISMPSNVGTEEFDCECILNGEPLVHQRQ